VRGMYERASTGGLKKSLAPSGELTFPPMPVAGLGLRLWFIYGMDGPRAYAMSYLPVGLGCPDAFLLHVAAREGEATPSIQKSSEPHGVPRAASVSDCEERSL
jgi:hypothetical protein